MSDEKKDRPESDRKSFKRHPEDICDPSEQSPERLSADESHGHKRRVGTSSDTQIDPEEESSFQTEDSKDSSSSATDEFEQTSTQRQPEGVESSGDREINRVVEWPDYVTDLLRRKREKGKPDLSKGEIDRLQEYGFYVTEDLGQGIAGQVYKAYTHIDLEFDIPLEPGTPTEGFEVTDWRKCPTRKINLGGQACAIKKVGKIYRKELNIMTQLNHPNCILLYDYIEFGEGLYLILQFINGEMTLNRFLYQFESGIPGTKVLDEWTACLIIKHATLGLTYLHNLDIFHRDFHGGNIMPHNWAGKMIWKIFDFGLSTKKSSDKLYDIIDDLKAFNIIVVRALEFVVTPNETRDRISSVIDNAQNAVCKLNNKESTAENDLDSMQKICRALEPYFPLRGDGPEDEPPEDSAAYEFCNRFND